MTPETVSSENQSWTVFTDEAYRSIGISLLWCMEMILSMQQWMLRFSYG